MKTLSRSAVFLFSKLSSQIRLVMFILTLVLFILAAGAPWATGTVGG